MHCKVWGNGALRGGEALRDYGAAVDAACPWRVPERPGIGEDVLEEGVRVSVWAGEGNGPDSLLDQSQKGELARGHFQWQTLRNPQEEA